MEFDKIKSIISEVLSIDADGITEETTFVDDLGADSLDIFQIIMGIEEEFDIKIPDDAAEHIVSVGDAVEQIKNVYSMAREEGFNNINMDIILGLVGEDVDEVAHTLSEIEAMKPESLTVHSLAIKRAAALNIWRDKYKQLSTNNTDEIIRMTEDTAKRLSMEPYYMYRQKNMAGNFENVGYSVVGLECIYNILIMEEKQTIIACGAGASSKVVFHNEADDNHSVKIERIENVKDVRNYIQRIDEMIDRKKKFFEENNF